MTIGAPPVCIECRHYLRDEKEAKCLAIPEGIPDEIWYGDNNHSKPLPKQENPFVVFVKKKNK